MCRSIDLGVASTYRPYPIRPYSHTHYHLFIFYSTSCAPSYLILLHVPFTPSPLSPP